MAKVDKNWNTLRFQLTGASNGHFEKVCTLPPEVTLWRIHNLDELDVLWGPDVGENPQTDTGNNAALTLHGKSADVPPFIPCTLKPRRSIDVWARQTGSNNPTLEITWTTSEDPRVMATMAMGLVMGDVQIGQVEVKDASGAITQTVTSGSDGLHRAEVSISGQPVTVSGIANVSGSVVVVLRAQSVLSGNLFTTDLNLTAGQVLTSQSTAVTIASQDAIAIQAVAVGASANASGEVITYWGLSLDGTNFAGVNNMSNAVAMTLYLNGGNTVYKVQPVDVRGVSTIRCVGVENKAGVAVSGVNVRLGFSSRLS